ncbi:MAG: hypothetical protein PHY93_06710 [Bacteriovorax sp.]|nr:hypothetical protein [Bacteriovorax sp.]
MNSRHKLDSFKKETIPLLELVTGDIYLESIWLSNMSMLEDIAAKYILSNITEATPSAELRNIIEHVKDEQRHAKLLLEMRPATIYPDNKYYVLEEEWRKIGHEFIMGFFNSPHLREANHRHAAYVHGAQTIERFPFRIYSLYLSMTKLSKAHELLPGIISDEFGHIELGKSMYAKLSPEDRMPLTNLYRLEEELCLMMLKRMNLALRQCWNLYQPDLDSALELKLMQNSQFEVAWNYALSCGEKHFSHDRADRLKEANTLLRAPFRTKPGHRELEKTLEGILSGYIFKSLKAGLSENIIQNRFDSHYRRMIYNTNCIPLHYAYFRILEDHLVKEAKSDEHQLEQKLWAELILEISEISQADQYENGLSLSRA